MRPQTLRKIRLSSQIVFFGLFILLLIKTEFHGSLRSAATEIRLPYPVGIFLQTDPLIALSNALSTHALYHGLIWCLVILIPTFILGRFFCGWICPLGSMNHFFSDFKSERKRGLARIESNRYKKWQTLKYYILVALLVSAVFGGLIVGVMDPISLAVRSLGLSILPGINYALNAFLDGLYNSNLGILRIPSMILPVVLQALILSFKQPYFRQAFFLGLLFIAIMVLNLRITRFWCRALCPLGALLGITSRWAILGMEKHTEKCHDCNRCALHCQGGDDPVPGAPWRKAECHLCFNCVGDCPEDGIKFKFFPGGGETVDRPQLQRRRVFAGVAAGVGLLPLLRSTSGFAVESDPRLIRPPGALAEKEFLARCIRCGECMKVCPNNALQPTLLEAGLEGIWTPVLAARIGYCEPTCVLCSQVCPTGAIWEITQAEKIGSSQGDEKRPKPVKLGTAFYDRGRCLPWAMATECIVCEEWCPTSPKAVYLRPVEMADGQGAVKTVRQPYVDPERCTGCGACEHVCPVKDRPAVYITSIGESRSATNQILLRQGGRAKG
jgi:polyferredoxin